MRKVYIAAILLLGFAVACQKTELANQEEGENCLVSFSVSGDISTTEAPLTRAGSPNDLYAVQVMKGSTYFAFGIFDDVQAMSLNLKKGSTYSVRMCLVRDAKVHLADYYSLTNGGLKAYNDQVGPFYFWTYSSSYFLRTNKFYYNSNNSFEYYPSATATSTSTHSFYSSSTTAEMSSLRNIRKGTILNTNYPMVSDWFYGELSNYVPTGEKETKSISLVRTGFKLQYQLEGVTDGEVTVKISNSYTVDGSTYSRTFFNSTTNTASYTSADPFIAFYDTYSAWQYADNYTENLTVSVTWKRGIGVTQDLGTKTIQVKRNCLNKVKITLGSDDRGAGVNLSTEAESSMGSVSNDIPVQ